MRKIQRVIFLKKFKEYSFIYCLGGVIYSAIEVAFRGFTHWTMALTGGLAYLLIYISSFKIKSRSMLLRCLTGSAIITALEFIVGCIVNRRFGLAVWDYSARPGHILGQICPLFSMIWFLLSFPATLLSFFLKKRLFTPGSSKSKLAQLFLK